MSSSGIISPANYETLKSLHESNPNSAEIANAYRNALVIRGDFALLAESYAAIPPDKRTGSDNLNLARAYLKLGRPQDAINVIKDPGNAAGSEIELNALLGRAYFVSGDYDAAAKYLDSSWAEFLRDKRIDEINTRGLIYYRLKQYDKCIETMSTSLNLNPDNRTAANTLSRVYSELNDPERAAHYRRMTTEIHDRVSLTESRAIRFTSRIYDLQDAWTAKKYDEVARIANELIPDAPADKQKVLYQYLIESYKALGNTAAAEKAAEDLRRSETK